MSKSLFDMYGTESNNSDSTKSTSNTNNLERKVDLNGNEDKENLIDIDNGNDRSFINVNKDSSNNQKDTKAVPDAILNNVNDDGPMITNEELIRDYVGPNYDSIARGGFSLHVLLLGPTYLFYRKQYFASIALFTVNVLYLFPELGIPAPIKLGLILASLAIQVFYSLFFKMKYMKEAKNYVNYLQTLDLSNGAKKKKAMLNGGVDKRVYLIFTLLIIGMSIFRAKDYLPRNLEETYKKSFNANYNYVVPSWADSNIEVISDDSSVKNGFLYHDKIFTYTDSNNKCSYRVSYNNEYITSNNEFNIVSSNYMNDTFNKDLTPTNENYNGLVFRHYYDEDNKIHYYVHPDDYQMMVLKVDLEKTSNDECMKLTKDILNSIEKK